MHNDLEELREVMDLLVRDLEDQLPLGALRVDDVVVNLRHVVHAVLLFNKSISNTVKNLIWDHTYKL